MKRRIVWLSYDVVLAIHERLLAEHGGAAGLRDPGLLESALARPRHFSDYSKPDIFTLAAAYAHALTANHPFLDGNKRISLATAALFLELNGHSLQAPEAEAVTRTLALAAGQLSPEAFAQWLRESCRNVAR